MCGIVGIASRRPLTTRHVLALASESLRHRGPDGAGEWWSHDGRVGLAHRRLAIIDLSPAGSQPMHNAAGDVVIVFNGELYNFRPLRAELEGRGHHFRSSSDTEVVLAAYAEWDLDCLERFEGMFAFALYDAPRDRLLLARDRAGEKPLYVAASDERIAFASELKALMACDSALRTVDPLSLDCYLGLGYVPGDGCILKGVRKLPPAHAMSVDLASGATRTWRYWRMPAEPAGHTSVSLSQLTDELEALLQDAVARQLVADVPVGVLLSGGVDSSLVTAMAARAQSRLRTFTIVFPGYAALDEARHARRVASHFGTEHTELTASEATPSLLPQLARQYDEPLIDSSMVPTYLVSHLVRQACTVALGGDGGDELFGGYQHYDRLEWLAARSRLIPRLVRRGLSAAAVSLLPTGARGRNWAAALGVDLARDLPLIASYFDRSARERLVPSLARLERRSEDVWRERVLAGSDLMQRATRTDFDNYLPEDILVKVDRASMLNSLEVRAPFLDRRVIEFAFGRVPTRFKVADGKRKILLRALAGRVLPRDLDQSRKQGFCIPLAAWLKKGPWRKFFEEVLLHHDGNTLARTEMEALWKGQDAGRQNAERLFGLVMFELWRQTYGVTLAEE